MTPSFAEWPETHKKISSLLEMCERKYFSATYSFDPNLSPDIFNLMDKSEWITPAAGEYHWLFDVLMQSLGAGIPENIDHIEHLICAKYTQPECFIIPCLIIHGEGGVGKNVLVEAVLQNMFGRRAVIQTGADKIAGKFNSSVEGKTVVMINESDTDHTDSNKLKQMVGSQDIMVERKGVDPFKAANTAWYIVSSNKSDGGIWLDRSNADRRYSVCRVEKGQTLAYWIARHNGALAETITMLDEKSELFKKTTQWMWKVGNEILRDKDQVAMWLHSLIQKHGHKPVPDALHSTDYERLMKIQKPMDEQLIEAVFSDEDFTHILSTDLLDCYSILCRQANVRAVKGKTKLFEAVEGWIKLHDPNICTKTRWRQNNDTKSYGWYNTTVSSSVRHKPNRDDYINESTTYDKKYVGPAID
jgi:hypothetical protein